MQNRYVGDVGDFGKFGLLRWLSGLTDEQCPEPYLRLGVVWYLSHDPREHNQDGRHIQFLQRTTADNKAEYIDCDPELWDKLRDLVFRNARCVHCAQDAELLPQGTPYFDPLLYFPQGMRPATRRAMREEWLASARRRVAEAELVFFDPDNGLLPATVGLHSQHGPKYAAMDDLAAFWAEGKSLVLYQQGVMDRNGLQMVEDKKAEIRGGLELDRDPLALWFHRGTGRVFFVVPQLRHQQVIENRIRRMAGSALFRNGHFSQVG